MNLDESLYKTNSDKYGPEYQNHLLEQYKLYVQMADKISERRQSTNSFFLTVNTAVLAFLGIVVTPSVDGATASAPLPWILVVSAAGLILCYYWYRLVLSYKGLNTGKFEVIHAIEGKLPSSPYDAEWESLGRGSDPERYLPFTNVETRIPWVFAALYGAFAVWNIFQASWLGF